MYFTPALLQTEDNAYDIAGGINYGSGRDRLPEIPAVPTGLSHRTRARFSC